MSYSWTKVALTPLLALGTGIYWFVLTRSGSIDLGNFFKLKVNEDCGYSRGVFKLNNGSTWGSRIPDADLNFSALGRQETTDQIQAIASDAAAAQFLAGVKIEADSALYSSPYRSGLKTALQEIRDLLASGTSAAVGLVASMDANRVLHISAKPSAVALVQGEDGVIRDMLG